MSSNSPIASVPQRNAVHRCEIHLTRTIEHGDRSEPQTVFVLSADSTGPGWPGRSALLEALDLVFHVGYLDPTHLQGLVMKHSRGEMCIAGLQELTEEARSLTESLLPVSLDDDAPTAEVSE